MDWSHLQTFLAVANSGSFTAASETLNVSKGSISRHIEQLERSLNSKLFYRTTRKVSLSESGQALFAKAMQMQLLAAEAEMRINDLADDFTGDLKVTAPLELGQALCKHVVPQFIRQHPDVNLIFNFDAKKQEVESGDFDIAFRAFDSLPQDVVAKTLGDVRNVLVCHADYALAHNIKGIDDLHKCAFITNGHNEQWNTLTLSDAMHTYTIEVTGTIRVNTYGAINALVNQNLGVGSLPYYQVEEQINDGTLVHLLPDFGIKTHKLSLLYAQRKVTPRKIVAFNQAVGEWIKSSPLYLVNA